MEQSEQILEDATGQTVERGWMTDLAIGAGPTVAVVANQAIETIKNRPPDDPPPSDPPPQIVLPPGIKTDE